MNDFPPLETIPDSSSSGIIYVVLVVALALIAYFIIKSKIAG